MKDFEKYYNELPMPNLYDERRGTWKAALEWVKSRSDVAKSLYMINVNELDNELQE